MQECDLVCQVLKNAPEINAWLFATFTAIGLVLRALADFIAFVGAKIESKTANDLGQKINHYALLAAKIVGWFGGGIPRRVFEEKKAASATISVIERKFKI